MSMSHIVGDKAFRDKLFQLALPIALQSLLVASVSAADAFMLGRFEQNSMAAVSLATQVQFVMTMFIGAVTMGGTVLGAQYYGKILEKTQKQVPSQDEALPTEQIDPGRALDHIFNIMMRGMILIDVLFWAACLFVPRLLMLFFTGDPELIRIGCRYLKIAGWSYLLVGFSQAYHAIMKISEHARMSLYVSIAAVLINIVLNAVLIFGLIGFPRLGAAGAAIATVIGQVVSCMILFFMTRHEESIAIRFKNFSPSWKAFKEIFFGGSPSLNRQGMMCISVMLLNHAAGSFGDAAIAGMSIVNRVTMMIMAFVIGLGQGFQPVCGFCYGAKLFPRLRQAYWFTVKVGFIFLLCCAALGWFFSPHIIGLFRNDPEVIAVGTVAFHWQLCSLPLNIFTMSGNMLTQTCRKPVAANILAAARNGLFFIPFILILPHFFGLLGVEMCQTWSDVCAFTLSVPMILHTLKNL